MTRPIKFRIWDKEAKIMDYQYQIEFSGDMAKSMPISNKDYLVPMQYTGLKDKNSKEIYEGDIVKDVFGRVAECYWYDKGVAILTGFTFRSFKKEDFANG
jgi:uncharacterized phage protein (TIGR01671 family)